MVGKTVDTKMWQTVWNNDISFGKIFAHDQLSHLVIAKINHVAMVTTFKNSKWRPSAQVSDFTYIYIYIYIYFLILKQLKIIKNTNFQRKTTEFVT